jgi:tetratricopeptide (TPR) repeat protein
MARDLQPTPASDEPVYEIDSFEMLWEQHKAKIIGGSIAIIALLVVVFGWLIFSNSQRKGSEKAFASATTAADYRAVLEKYPSSPVAGGAALLLAESLRGEKKYDEAIGVLDGFATANPEHPFATLAKVSAATNLALSGKYEDAEKALQLAAQADTKSFAAPYALLLEAEMKVAGGDRAGAVKAYRELSKSFPESIAVRAAAPAYQALEALEPTASPVPAAAVEKK